MVKNSNQPDLFHKYGHTDSLNKMSSILDCKYVICTEKLHGTNMRFGIINGKFRIGSRNQEWDANTTNDGFGFLKWSESNIDKTKLRYLYNLYGNIIFYGEFIGKGIGKGITYFADDTKDYRVFAVRINGKFQDFYTVMQLASILGLRTVPLLFVGHPEIDKFKAIYDRISTEATQNGIELTNNICEGIVIYSYPLIENKRGDLVIAKFKNDKFSEKAHQPKHPRNSNKNTTLPAKCKEFIDSFITETRLEHVVLPIQADHSEPLSMSEMGEILKNMMADIERECADELNSLQLNNQDYKQLKRHIIAKTKTLYKAYLNAKL
ncbi:MAG: RNA ligase family protein [Candidatus Odinarchaeia archaeon]